MITFVKHPTTNKDEIYIRDYWYNGDPNATDEELYRDLYEDIFEDDNYSEDVVIQIDSL